MASVNPHITFNGNCEEAFNFYKSVFGGDFSYMGRFKDMPSGSPIPDNEKDKIMHVALPLGHDTVLMGSDNLVSFGRPFKTGNNFTVSVSAESEEEAKRIFNGLSQGGKVDMPLNKAFWGALFGMCTDKFGIQWMVNYQLPQQK